MSEELTAKEALQITAEICEENSCNTCPLNFSHNTCRGGIAKHADKTIEICKKWKAEHTPIEVEWVHVCRTIEDTGNKKQCVFEKDICEDDVLPFENNETNAESILKEYCKNHKGNFFATVERICRKREK